MDKNREFAELVEIPWHEEISVAIFCGEDRFRCSCGAFYDKRQQLLDHVEKSNPGLTADPRLVLREMMKREDWPEFITALSGINTCINGHYFIRVDLILDTTGKLRDNVIEFLRKEKR